MTSNPVKEEAVTLLPCPFPHEVRRGVFLEIDTEDFGFVRGACSDCGCAGPFVTLVDLDRVTDGEKAKAARLWNTRQADPRIAELEAALEKIAGGHIPADASRCIPGNWQPAFGALQDIARATLNRKDKP